VRVAVVVEQCWHRVPGGTAGAVVDQVAAVSATGRVRQVGVAARHRHPPPEPWRPAIPIRHLPLPRAALYRTWHRWRRPAVERATGPVDVVHATGYAIPPRTRPLVVTMHDLAWRRDPSMFTANGVRFFEAGLRCVVADADLVLCPSQATLDDCAAAGIRHDRLRHVPWGMDGGTIDADVAEAEVARVRRAHGLEGRYVLSVGTLEPRKNLPRLLDAFARLTADGDGRHADVTLAVVGPAGWGDSLAGPAARLGDRVRLVGFVPRGDLAPLYRGAAVVCYPSLWEGYGLPVAEALAAGAPVVTSAGTATEELVAGGVGLLVDPRDPDAIAGALASVLDDDDLAERLRRAARKRAAETTWATTAALTIAAYEEAAGG
jgi:glycosyltransferase involved in cell wall biosynthesis